jgi:hypothetical protein
MSEYYKKYIKYKNKYINLKTQMGGVLGDELRDEPPPVVRKGNQPYAYDRDAREIAEAEARIANRDYEDKVGLFKQAIKDKDDLKKEAQNKPYRKSIHRWPYPEIVEQRIKDYDITTRNRSLDYLPVPRRGGEPNHYYYDHIVKFELETLAEALFRIANRANEDEVGLEQQRIKDEKVAMNIPVREYHSWPFPSIVSQRRQDDNLINANKEFLKANKDYLEKYNLYPTELLDIF